MANGNNDVAEMLANPDGIGRREVEPANLRDVNGADIVDVTDRLGNQTKVTSPENFGQRSGSFMNKLGDTLENPNTIRALAAFGTAFAGGRPDQPGTILGQFAMGEADRIEGQAERRIMSRLLAGEELEDIPQEELSQLTPEGLGRLEEIRSGRAQEDRQDQQITQQDRALELREQGLNIEQAGLDLRESALELNKEEFDHRVETEQTRLGIEEGLADSLIALREARIENLGDDAGTGGTDNSVMLRRENAIRNLGRLVESTQEQLDFAERDVESLEGGINVPRDRPGLSEIGEETGNPFSFISQALLGRQRELDIEGMSPEEIEEAGLSVPEGLEKARERRDALRYRIQEQENALDQMQRIQQQALRGGLEDGGDTNTVAQTKAEEQADAGGDIIPTITSDQLGGQESGEQFYLNGVPQYEGILFEVNEDGTYSPVGE